MGAVGVDDLLMRHVRACNNAVLPGGRRRLLVRGQPVGVVASGIGRLVEAAGGQRRGGALVVPDVAALEGELMAQGACGWRGEAFDVHADRGGAVLGRIDRGCMPCLGLITHNAHLNGLVRRADGWHVWVATRAAHKLVAPGTLDNIVAGGVPAGLSPWATLVKEAAEEAGISPDLARAAVPVGRIAYAMQRAEGLRREVLHCFDLELPEDFVPCPVDGEVAGFTLWPIRALLQAVRETERVMYDVNLVLIDLFARHGLLPFRRLSWPPAACPAAG